jgi:bifunctional UDP-N-acetylglucosamine pyrophosphorylase/glucosamine-1-phosphate N-acetyltransferase
MNPALPGGSAVPPPSVAILLAAGRGERMRSSRPKALHSVLGRSLLQQNIDLCRRLGVAHVVAVVPAADELIAPAVEGLDVLLHQEQPLGSADAAALAARALVGEHAAALVVPAASVILAETAIHRLVLRRIHGKLDAILLERNEQDQDPAALLCDLSTLIEQVAGQQRASESGELELRTAFLRLARSGARAEIMRPPNEEEVLMVRDRIELAHAAAVLRRRVLETHMRQGVTIVDPHSTYIDLGIEIGRDTVIHPMTHLHGATQVGEEAELGPNVRITDCSLGHRVVVQNAVLAESTVGDETRIGPFAQLRPGCRIGRKVKIGNFVELKNAVVADGASLGHLAYVGDASVGAKANIGAGTITCNYDGERKHPTKIGAGAFIGSHTTLVAPVEVGDGAYTAAGSVITEDVPVDALAIARERQAIKPEWARKRREREKSS